MPATPDLLLTGARLPRVPGDHQLLISGGRIAAVDPAGGATRSGVERLALDGRYVIPGLWDAHVHFTQWVIRQQRLDLAGTTGAADVLERVRGALAGPDGSVTAGSSAPFLVGYGFRDALWPDAPSVAALDAAAGDRPVVLISGDLHCGWLSSTAARRLGVSVPASGILSEAPWMAALEVLDRESQPGPDAYRRAAEAAAARGVAGIVDFENAPNTSLWPRRAESGVTGLRVQCSIWPDRLEEAIAAGLRTGRVLDADGLITVGRLKIIVDGSLNTRTAWCHDPYPDLDPAAPESRGIESVPMAQVEQLVRRAHQHGILPAVHAIGDRCNHEVLDVFERLGIPGTIEHAQLVAAGDVARFGALGVTASVQPEHAMDDRDVADHHWAGRTGGAFPYRSLHDAGATLHLGSDAPVAPLDPWVAMAAAVFRARDGREPWHPEQRLPIDVALAASTRSRIAVGEVADLAVLDADPTTCPEPDLRAMPVTATIVAGRITWNAL